ncbi:hypothetical protein Vadar_005734 [Vaccinium darrowii]|uniref:Uncharacterized protein n=1 Tax=Vaccinium darrowii TaxID=229202 RepID=A0ACB7XNG3_9ERIC|nr:hypothetical protein Vadar_005734 [Vaccinium darrowii]
MIPTKMVTHRALGAITANIAQTKAARVAKSANGSSLELTFTNSSTVSSSAIIAHISKNITAMEQHIATVSAKMNALSETFFMRIATPKSSGLVSNPPGIVNAAAKVIVARSVATRVMVLINGFKSRPPAGTSSFFGCRPFGAPWSASSRDVDPCNHAQKLNNHNIHTLIGPT